MMILFLLRLGTIDKTARQKHEQFDIVWIVELCETLLVLVGEAGADQPSGDP